MTKKNDTDLDWHVNREVIQVGYDLICAMNKVRELNIDLDELLKGMELIEKKEFIIEKIGREYNL